MPVAVKGTGGGSVTLSSGAAAADTTLTLPNTTGTVALTASPTFSGALTATTITSPSATALTIQSAGTTAMTVDTSQNVGINSTSPSSFGKFVVAGPSATNVYVGTFLSNTAGDTAYAPLFVVKYDNNTTTSQVFQRFAINNNTAASGQINANGANAVAFGTWSDERLKENIVSLPPQLANICALRPVEFDYIKCGGHQVGFIAQEMREIFPDAVGVGDNDMLTISGWSKTEARLVSAIQELSAKNDALEARLAALEAK